MFGSISKVRPIGHRHTFKYAHCTNTTDIININSKYKDDISSVGGWSYTLDNVKTLNTDTFKIPKLKTFEARTPKLQTANQMFGSDATTVLTKLDMDYNNLTGCQFLFSGSNLDDFPKNFNPKATIFNHTFSRKALANIVKNKGGSTEVPFYESLNNATNLRYCFQDNKGVTYNDYTFPKAKEITAAFGDNDFDKCPPNLSFKSVVSFNRAFYNNKNLTSFQTVDEMSSMTDGSEAFTNCTGFKSLYPEYESFKWPKMSTAAKMFSNCILDKESIIKLSDALSDWSSDGKNHIITIGCHIDHKYDPDVNIALKKLDSNYISPIEEYGSSLSTSVSSFKGWTITVQWNGTKTENAYPEPS